MVVAILSVVRGSMTQEHKEFSSKNYKIVKSMKVTSEIFVARHILSSIIF